MTAKLHFSGKNQIQIPEVLLAKIAEAPPIFHFVVIDSAISSNPFLYSLSQLARTGDVRIVPIYTVPHEELELPTWIYSMGHLDLTDEGLTVEDHCARLDATFKKHTGAVS